MAVCIVMALTDTKKMMKLKGMETLMTLELESMILGWEGS